jgi:hypothetical protein
MQEALAVPSPLTHLPSRERPYSMGTPRQLYHTNPTPRNK